MLRDFTKDTFDIIIQAGQSNSAGYGFGREEKPFQPNENIWYLNNDFTISQAHEEVFGNEIANNFALSFAQEYMSKGQLKSGRRILIIRAAIGGTGFVDHRWGMKDDLFLTMMEMIKTALELNPSNKLVAFLWHQGETDVGGVADKTYPIEQASDIHYKNLSTLVNAVRETFDVKKLPFIAGDFVHDWKGMNIESCMPIIAAIRKLCEIIGKAAFVETENLQSNNQNFGNGDTIHFCRGAQSILGKRYYAAYLKIINL